MKQELVIRTPDPRSTKAEADSQIVEELARYSESKSP